MYISWAFVFYLSLKAHYWWFVYEAFAKVTSIPRQIAIAIKCHYIQYQMSISVWGKLDCYCLLRIVKIKMNPKIGYVACHSASTVCVVHVLKKNAAALWTLLIMLLRFFRIIKLVLSPWIWCLMNILFCN